MAVAESRALGRAETDLEHEDRAARRNTRLLFFFATLTLGAVDAYIDAQLADFEVRPDLALWADGGGLYLRLAWF